MESNKLLKSLSLLCMLLFLMGCFPIKQWPEERAQVINIENNKPLEGVIVVAFWRGTAGGSHASGTCYHVESATTDAQGRFVIPAFTDGISESFTANKYTTLYFYKPGYKKYIRPDGMSSTQQKIYRMEPFKGTREERLTYLKWFPTGCDEAGDSIKNSLHIKKKLYEEAKRIAVTKKDKDIVETLLFGLESLEFDDNTALKRMIKRRETGK